MSLFDRPSAPPAHLSTSSRRFFPTEWRCWTMLVAQGLKLLPGGDGLGAGTTCLRGRLRMGHTVAGRNTFAVCGDGPVRPSVFIPQFELQGTLRKPCHPRG